MTYIPGPDASPNQSPTAHGVPLGMSRIYSECPVSAFSDIRPADVLFRQEPDEEDDEEEDDSKREPDEEEDDDDAEDDGYSEWQEER